MQKDCIYFSPTCEKGEIWQYRTELRVILGEKPI